MAQSQNTLTNNSMVDVILAVPQPYQWHKENLVRHKDHYSLTGRIGGARFVTWVQENFGARLYFHPFVSLETTDAATTTTRTQPTRTTRQIKYGVVSTDALISDLLRWDYLYLAGRMQKPIVSIDAPTYEGLTSDVQYRRDGIEEAQRSNLLAAVSTSLLLYGGDDGDHAQHKDELTASTELLPTSKLFGTIASLSYTGDFRMKTGAEDPNKVAKLVETPGMHDLWEQTYSESLQILHSEGLLSIVENAMEDGGGHTTNRGIKTRRYLEFHPNDVAIRRQLIQYLPPRLQHHSDLIVGSSSSDVKSIRNGSLLLRNELANIVAPAAKSQGMKGFFTAGAVKSWNYAMAKFSKGRFRK